MPMRFSDSSYRYFAEGRPQIHPSNEADPLRDFDRLASLVIARRSRAVVSFANRSGIDLSDSEVRAEVVDHTALVRAEREVAINELFDEPFWEPIRDSL